MGFYREFTITANEIEKKRAKEQESFFGDGELDSGKGFPVVEQAPPKSKHNFRQNLATIFRKMWPANITYAYNYMPNL